MRGTGIGKFTCAKCGGTWDKSPGSDEAAAAEAKELWGYTDPEAEIDSGEAVVVCDDCWKLIMGPA